MSCLALTAGYSLECKDGIGGIVEVYFIEKSNLSAINEASGVVTGITKATGKRFWKVELPQNVGSVTEPITASIENGTVFHQPTLVIAINRLTVEVRNLVRVLAKNNLVAVFKRPDSTYWLIGKTRGLDISAGDLATGTAAGDRSGSNLTFLGTEPDPMLQVEASVAAALETAG